MAVQKKNPFKKCRSIAFKIGTTIDIDTFLAKRSRMDFILGLLVAILIEEKFKFNSDEVITFVCSAIDAKYR